MASELIVILIILSCLNGIACDCGGRNSGKPIVEVLMWSGGSWAGFLQHDVYKAPNYLGHEVDKREWDCPIDCRYTGDKKKIGSVDGVIFEAQPITSYYDDYRRSPPNFPSKYPHQKWINYGYETQYYFHLYGDRGYMDLIDTNMTFTLDSQVPISFHCMWGGGKREDLLKPPPPKSKDKCIAYFNTNCASGGAIHRTAYVKELMNYINVHSYGRCLHNRDLPEHMQTPLFADLGGSLRNKVQIFSEYKFVLSFENNNVTDYVTEKMPNVLQAGTVPVYMGSPNIHPYWTPGEHSLIQTQDFKSPKELAKYLNYLCENDDEYYKYFEWKKKGFSPQFKQRLDDCVFYGAECRLCQYLYAQRESLTREQKEVNEKRRSTNHVYLTLLLDGVRDYLRVSDQLTVHKEFSISAWIHPTKEEMPILHKGGIQVNLKHMWKRSYLELCVGSSCYVGSHPIFTDTWYFFVIVYKYDENGNSYVKFYTNGCEDQSSDVPIQSPSPNHDIIYIGTDSERSSYFRGKIDDISIWNIAITPERAKKVIFEVLSPLEPGLLASWDFHAMNKKADDVKSGVIAELIGDPVWQEGATKPLVTVAKCF